MPVRYKIEILPALKSAGFNTSRLRKEKLLGESVIQQLRTGALVSWANIARICELLNCQPGDILEYISDPEAPQDDAFPEKLVDGKNTPLSECVPESEVDW